jgi:hypothetical protein
MIKTFRLALFLVLSLPAGPLLSEASINELLDGRLVRIDPATRIATVYSDSGSTQLWDGTHRLKGGEVIIVRDGVVVSESRREEPAQVTPDDEDDGATPAPVQAGTEAHPIPEEAACVKLAVKVCGFDGECSDSQGCSPARQLVELEKEEAWANHAPNPTYTTMQCQQALQNEAFFTPCNKKPESPEPTPCEQLLIAACGDEEQCNNSEACAAAKQLFQFEVEERIEKIRRPERTPVTSKRCTQARQDPFFEPCPVSEDQN